MVGRLSRRLDQGLDRDLRRRDVGIAKAQIDDIDPGEPCRGLAPIHLGERVGR